MRRMLGVVAVMATVGACALGLWAGVGRAAGPAPVVERPASPEVLAATVHRPDAAPSDTQPVARPAVTDPPPASAPWVIDVPAADEPAPAPVVEAQAAVPVASRRPATASAAPAPRPATVVTCGTGPDGSFVAVADVADCPGSAALVIVATADA